MNAIADAIDFLLNLLRNGGLEEWGPWSYVLLGLLVIIEGPIVTLLGAVAASAGYMRLWLVVLSALVASAIADSGWYFLGYAHAEESVLRYGRRLGLRRRHLDRLQEGMQQHSLKFLLVAKLTAGFAIPTLIAAGLARVPFRRWFPIVFVGEVLWVLLLTFIGYQATGIVHRVELGLHYLPLLGGLALLVLVLAVSRRFHPNREEDEDDRQTAESASSPPNAPLPAQAEAAPAVLPTRNGPPRNGASPPSPEADARQKPTEG